MDLIALMSLSAVAVRRVDFISRSAVNCNSLGTIILRAVKATFRPRSSVNAAMSMTGHVVVTFNVHKDGSITDLAVAGASPIQAFNNAAYGALSASNPTQPLPPEYPSDKAFFTVTFFYNENPNGRD